MMSITVTSDPIISAQLIMDLLGIQNTDKAAFLINSVSTRFLKYTGRLRITNGAVTEYQATQGGAVFWLHATPITAVTSVQALVDGAVTVTITGYDLDNETGKLALHQDLVPGSYGENTLKAVYTAGWTTVPGDVQMSAIQLVRVEYDRMSGRAGYTSEAAEGHSVSYQVDTLPKSVEHVWNQYRFEI